MNARHRSAGFIPQDRPHGWQPRKRTARFAIRRSCGINSALLGCTFAALCLCRLSPMLRRVLSEAFDYGRGPPAPGHSAAKPQPHSLSSIGWRRGLGRGGAFFGNPLSSVLSPLVPRGEREGRSASRNLCRKCANLHHCVTDQKARVPDDPSESVSIRVHPWLNDFGCGSAALRLCAFALNSD